MKIKDIIGLYVFVTDTTTGQGLRLSVKEFGNNPQKGANVEYRDNKYWCTSQTVDENCLNGVCSLKMPDNN